MNLYTCTAKIIEEPIWIHLNNIALSKIIMVRPNNRKNKSYYSIRAVAKGKVAKLIVDHYRKDDIVIIEGYIYIKKISLQQKNNKQKYKVKKYIAMKIKNIYSLSVSLQ